MSAVRVTGPPIPDLHGIPVTVGADCDSVTIEFGGTRVMFLRTAAEEFQHQFIAACWEAAQYEGRTDREDGGNA
jgi:hypothetical protein